MFTYNRPIHTKRVLDALVLAKVSTLSVYMDGPKDKSVNDSQVQILSILDSTDKINIILNRRIHNHGLAKSITSALDSELSKCDAVIIIEDDCLPHPNFVGFMSNCLNYYRKEKLVRSIVGYQFPFFTGGTWNGVLRARRFMPWGWATWADRWCDYSKFDSRVTSQELLSEHFKFPIDVRNQISDFGKNIKKNDIWSVPWTVGHYLTNTFSIYPPYPLIQNIGMDGSGVHCPYTSVFHYNEFGQENYDIEINRIKSDEGYDRAVENFMKKNNDLTMVKRGLLA